ncbi:hypothetical protein AAF712_010796 [Marasmius tenuissimus]|uniref:Uncharacterized protein n=1 Tax=Marasmius tenuissimus TaxID=585030 RepID=A0ABR2ZKW9_9AGAR
MFHSASHTNITGGSFNIVHGTQNNNHYYQDSQSSSERRLVRIQPGEEWKEMLYQEYERIHIRRINLLRTLHRAEYRPGLQAWRWHMGTFHKVDYPEADRVVEIASIVDQDGRNESKPLLAVKYTGRGAKKLFAGDCMLFSRQRTTNLAQLRAYNDSDIPIIIFNEELISLEHFLKYNKSSAETCATFAFGTIYLTITSSRLAQFLVFFAPLSGPELISKPGWLMCRKPYEYGLGYGPRSLNFFHAIYWHPMLNAGGLDHHDLPGNHLQFPPSPRDAGSHALFNYLICNFPERMVLSAACWGSSFYTFGLEDEDARACKMSLIDGGSLSERTLALPFHWWAFLCESTYCCPGGQYRVMENGEMRFLSTRTADYSKWFSFKQYEECSTNCEQGEDWLAQAGRIFTHFGPRREWEFCRFITKIRFILDPSLWSEQLYQSWQQWSNNPNELEPPCYLFVLPLPQCPDSTPDIETWLRGENLYYYSYNPEGGSTIAEEECISLGLPFLTSDIWADYLQWDDNVYEFMEKWQKAKGFDYTTADYAKLLGIPDLSANPQEGRFFEDLTDSPDVLEADPMDADSDDVAHIREISSSSGLPEAVEDDRMDLD